MEKFDIKKLTDFAIAQIIIFSETHQNEIFYGFSIDGNLLCFNSEEKFQETLSKYRIQWGGYTSPSEMIDLKLNTGDWSYQGFAKFGEDEGFDMESYLEHYHADEEDQINSEYSKAMKIVIKNLKKSSAFEKIKKTKDFFVNTIEHNY